MIEHFEITKPKSTRELLGELALARSRYYETMATGDEEARKAARVLLAIHARSSGHEIPAPVEHDFSLEVHDERDPSQDAAIKISGRTAEGSFATVVLPQDPEQPAALTVVSPDEDAIVWRHPAAPDAR